MKQNVEKLKNDEKKGSTNWIKYLVTIVVGATVMGGSYLLPTTTFQAFIIGWLFLIPTTVVVYIIFGLKGYMRDEKNKIDIVVKPTPAMLALSRRYQELDKERNMIYEDMIQQ